MPNEAPDDLIDTLWPGVDLSSTERALLVCLLAAEGRPVPRDTLLREVWGYAPGARTRTVEVTVRRLRTKIEDDPSTPRTLRNLRGLGYQLVPPGRAMEAQPPSREALERRLAEWLGEGQRWVTVLDAPDGRGTNLGPSLDALVGRDAERDALDTLLVEGKRLITIHGPAGVGKTRLAREVAAGRVGSLPGGVWFCDLSNARTASDAIAVVATELGILRVPGTGAAIAASVAALLRARGATLLVLDNFEQLGTDARDAVRDVLEAVPSLSLLVTSRDRLGLAGEHVHALAPLAPDDAKALLRARIEAIRIDRGAPLDDTLLAQIAALLDGLPLAIEMAAARARLLPLAELRARLGASLGVLRLDRPGAPARQRTLHDAIDWSWKLLSDDERRALVQLAAFRGGCTLEVAERFLRVDDDPLAVLGALLDRSMLRAWDQRGTRRVGMLAAIRAHALSRDHADLLAARERHAAWAVSLARSCDTVIETDPDARRRLLAALDDLLEAQSWLAGNGHPAALAILVALTHLHHTHGVPEDLAPRALATRERLRSDSDDVATLHLVLATAWLIGDESERARAEADAGLQRARPAHPRRSALLRIASVIARDRERYDDAIDHVRAAIASAEAHGAPPDVVHSHNGLGALLHQTGDLDAAIAAYRHAIAVAESAGVHRLGAIALANLGGCLAQRGDLDAGRAALDRAEARAAGWDDLEIRHGLEHQRALLSARAGDYAAADARFTSMLAYSRRLGGREPRGLVDVNAGIVALLVGDLPRARRLLTRAVSRLPWSQRPGRIAITARVHLLVAAALDGDADAADALAAALAAADVEDLPKVQRAERALALAWHAARGGSTDDRAALEAQLAEHPGLAPLTTLLQRTLAAATSA